MRKAGLYIANFNFQSNLYWCSYNVSKGDSLRLLDTKESDRNS